MSASWDGGVSLFHFGVTVTLTFDLVSRINIESGAYFGIIIGSRAYFHHFGTMTHTPGIGNFSA